MNIKILSQISLGLAISTTMISSPSFAQQNVDEIIVTARKVDESLQDVPVAVTALTRETIDNLNISILKTLQDTHQASVTLKHLVEQQKDPLFEVQVIFWQVFSTVLKPVPPTLLTDNIIPVRYLH